MPKKMKTTPAFLQKKLDDHVAAFVKANIAPFLTEMKKVYKGIPGPALKILPEFFVWLGDRDKRFRHIESGQLSTKHKGTYQVYNYLRKKIEKIEEKPPTPVAPITTRADTPRLASPARLKKAKEEEDEAVSIKATVNFEGHREEKETRYRRHMDSDQEESDPEQGEDGLEEESE